jgi:hypothetical protein
VFGNIVNGFTRASHALSFTFPEVAHTMTFERRRRLRTETREPSLRSERIAWNDPEFPKTVPVARARRGGFEEEDDTKCRIRLVP